MADRVESPEEVGHVGCMYTLTPPIDHRSPPPDPEFCLTRAYGSRTPKQKGGTLVAEGVVELQDHERWLRIDGYRPARCERCGSPVHAHEHRSRLLLGEGEGTTDIAIYRCADRESCGAVWRVLPGLLARHLWRAWSTVERAVADRADDAECVAPGLASDTGPPIPERTRARWRGRLVTSAALVVAVLSTAMDVREIAVVVKRAGYAATRGEVVALFAESSAPPLASGHVLGALAGVVHRLAPGVRLM
ncbi:MAG: hypothetical protein HYZ29_01335 [Myxococcales bacterium]|nr:hypothetical protein [Myxococcales bacterium]